MKQFSSSMTVRLQGPVSGNLECEFFGFMSEILPFLDATAIASNYKNGAAFCAKENADAIKSPLKVAICPSAPSRDPESNSFRPSLLFPPSYRREKIVAAILGKLDAKYSTTYVGGVSDYSVILGIEDGAARSFGYDVAPNDPVSLRGMFPSPFAQPEKVLISKATPAILGAAKADFSVHLKASDIVDGLSNTIMMTEDAGRPERWEMGARTMRQEPLRSAWADPMMAFDLEGRDQPKGGKCLMQCDNEGEIYSFHPIGANFVFADGHVSTLAKGIDGKVLVALVTPDKSESVQEPH
jgi:prepilin-type processing-associated H-X9-DG protein